MVNHRVVLAAFAVGAAFACSADDAPEFPAAGIEAAKSVGAQVDPQNLQRHVNGLYQARLKETPVISPFEPAGSPLRLVHVTSAAYMEEEFRALGYVPVVDESSGYGIDGLRTSYVDIPGREPEQVLITGHHDAWFQAGADDNASAMAVLLEAARIFKDKKPRRTIRIVAFDGEEEGFIGSVRYIAKHQADKIHMVLNMDCVGFAAHEHGTQRFPPGFAIGDIKDFDIGDFALVLANEPAKAGLSQTVRLTNVFPDRVRALGLIAPEDGHVSGTLEFLRSDQTLFWNAGIPALFFGDTANFRNPNYHTADDLPATIDYPFLLGVTKLVIGSAAAFAEAY